MTGFMAGILLGFVNPVNAYFVENPTLWAYPFLYAFATLIITVLMTEGVNLICTKVYKRNTFTLGAVLIIVLVYNLVLMFGGRLLSALLGDGAYAHEPMDYAYWSWHFYVYLISCACYISYLKYAHFVQMQSQQLPNQLEIKYQNTALPTELDRSEESLTLYQPVHQEKKDSLSKPIKQESIEVQRNDISVLMASNETWVFIKGIKVEVNKIFYLKAYQKYIDICVEEGNGFGTNVVRTSLASAEASLSNFPFMYRCHKSYLVNLDKLDRISGNTKGFWFHLKNMDEPIPVSRSNNDFVLRLMRERKGVLSNLNRFVKAEV